jgi:hypothetical protein
VEGTWKLAQGELALNQSFQMISGRLTTGSKNVPVTDGRLKGDRINFTAGNAQYTGSVNGNVMQGAVRTDGGTEKWSATRISEAIPETRAAK